MAITTNCQMMASEFESAAAEVTAIAKAPQRMLATLNGMVKNAGSTAMSVASSAFDSLVSGMIADLGLKAIVDDYTLLKSWLTQMDAGVTNCAVVIGNNPIVQAAIGTDLASMTGITDVTKITGMLKTATIANAKATAMAYLERGMSKMGIGGQIASANMGYKRMLQASGILDGIGLMGAMADCMEGLCPDNSGYQLGVESMMDGVHINSSQTVTNLWASQTSAVQTSISTTVNQGTAIANRINAWTGATDFV
jgi:hypothetical protein